MCDTDQSLSISLLANHCRYLFVAVTLVLFLDVDSTSLFVFHVMSLCDSKSFSLSTNIYLQMLHQAEIPLVILNIFVFFWRSVIFQYQHKFCV